MERGVQEGKDWVEVGMSWPRVEKGVLGEQDWADL